MSDRLSAKEFMGIAFVCAVGVPLIMKAVEPKLNGAEACIVTNTTAMPGTTIFKNDCDAPVVAFVCTRDADRTTTCGFNTFTKNAMLVQEQTEQGQKATVWSCQAPYRPRLGVGILPYSCE